MTSRSVPCRYVPLPKAEEEGHQGGAGLDPHLVFEERKKLGVEIQVYEI